MHAMILTWPPRVLQASSGIPAPDRLAAINDCANRLSGRFVDVDTEHPHQALHSSHHCNAEIDTNRPRDEPTVNDAYRGGELFKRLATRVCSRPVKGSLSIVPFSLSN